MSCEWRKLKPLLIRCAAITICVLGVFGLAAAISHLVYHRSLKATMMEIYISRHATRRSDEEQIKYLEKQREKGETTYKIPDSVTFCVDVSESVRYGQQVISLNESAKSGITIFYLHGGAYIRQTSRWQWALLDRLSRDMDAEIIVPVYSLAPHATFLKAYAQNSLLWQDLCKEREETDSRLILMGESAGGGLALGLAEYFAKADIEQPDQLILLSPWVDITMTNPGIEEYENSYIDSALDASLLVIDGTYWAGTADPYGYMLSPIYGDLEQLNDIKKVLLFVGTREMFCPDVTLLQEKLVSAGVNSELVIGEGMYHGWPVYPAPEAEQAIKIIESTILDKKNSLSE